VDDQFRTLDESQEIICHVVESGLVIKKFTGDAMYLQGAFINVSIGIQVAMEMLACQPSIDQFNTCNFNDPMSLPGIKAGCFGIQYDLPHSFSETGHPLIGQSVCLLISGMARVSPDPLPFHFVL